MFSISKPSSLQLDIYNVYCNLLFFVCDILCMQEQRIYNISMQVIMNALKYNIVSCTCWTQMAFSIS